MAINFPDSPSNGDTTTLAGKTYTFDSSKSKWSPSGAVTLSSLSVGAEATASGDGGIAYNNGSGVFTFTPAVAAGTGVTVHATQAIMIAASANEGSLHYENANNRLYVKAASGFYLLATVSNVTPTITDLTHTTDGTTATIADAATFDLTSGQNTVITLASSDPDVGQTLTHSATLTAGTLSNVASSFTQGSGADVNKFTIVPQTSGTGGSITYRFDVTDGIGTAQRTASFSITFQVLNSRYTSLLMSANAAGTNSTFTDSSSNNRSISVTGNPAQGSFTPLRRASYSIHMDGTDALSFANSADFQFGTDLFTIEGFYKFDSLPSGGGSNLPNSGPALFSKYGSGGLSYQFVFQNAVPNFNLNASIGGATVNITFSLSSSLSAQTWYHICLVRTASDTYKLFLDGTQVGGTQTQAGSINAGTGTFEIGRVEVGGTNYNNLIGSVHSFRVIKGAAVIPTSGGPTEPLTAVTNTKLLVAAKHPFMADGNSQVTAKTLTQVGDPVVRSSGPFDYGSTLVTDGGSIEFDGSGDALTLASGSITAPTGNFNLQFWVRPTSNSSNITIYDSAWLNGGICIFYHSSQTYYVFLGASSVTLNGVAGDAPVNSWHHICVTRNGSNLKLYLSGKEVDTSSTAVTFAQAAFDATTIGMRHQTSNRQYFNGLVSDLKFDSSNAVTGEFTPPTAPLSSSGADVHLKGQGAKVFDKSQSSNLALIGNTTGHATTKFSGAFSVFFDGGNSSDYIELDDGTAGSDFNLTNSTWTLETWFYKAQATGSRPEAIMGRWDNSNSTAKGWSWQVYGDNSRLIWSSDGSANTIYTDTRTVPSNQWVHLAMVKNGSTLTSYISGVGSAIHSSDFTIYSTTTKTRIGCVFASGAVSSTTLLRGYLQDLRVRKRAEYTSNFTPATAPLKG